MFLELRIEVRIRELNMAFLPLGWKMDSMTRLRSPEVKLLRENSRAPRPLVLEEFLPTRRGREGTEEEGQGGVSKRVSPSNVLISATWSEY